MTTAPDHLNARTAHTGEQPDERLGLALVLAVVALFVLFSFLVA